MVAYNVKGLIIDTKWITPLQYSNTGIFFQNLLHIFTTDVFPFMFHFYISTH